MRNTPVTSLFLGILGILLSGQLLLLQLRTNTLLARVNQLLTDVESGSGRIVPGDVLTSTVGRNEHRADVSLLKATSTSTLLFSISPTCEPCIATIPIMNKIFAETKDRVEVVVVTSAPPEQLGSFVAEHDIDVPLYSVSSVWLLESHLTATPTAVFVSNSGLVEAVWRGSDSLFAGESDIIEVASQR